MSLHSMTEKQSESSDDGRVSWNYLTFDTDLSCLQTAYCGGNDLEKVEVPDMKSYEDPLLWSPAWKTFTLWISCAATCLTTYAGGSYTAGVDQMAREWNLSTVVIETGVTAYTVGFAVTPMFLAPFSEKVGRKLVVVGSGLFYVLFVLCTGVTQSFAGMIVARFLVGAAASTFSTVIGGVIAELYEKDARNGPMSIFSAGALLGLALGPMVSGFVAQNLNWRWIFYIHAILAGALVAVMTAFYKETRPSIILRKKAKVLNKWNEKQETLHSPTKRLRWKTEEEDNQKSYWSMVATSTSLPFKLLFTEPIVFFFSLWITFAWSILYCAFSIVPYAFQTVYNFDLQTSEAIFASIAIGVILSAFISTYQETLARKLYDVWFKTNPEARLYFSCVEGVLLPVGLFWFGWTISAHIPWIVPTLALGFATFGIFAIYLAVTNYLADSYQQYSSSAIAAQSFCRNLAGGAFPLFTRQMFEGMGFGPAASLLGGVGTVLAIVPWVLVFCGPQIRGRSRFAAQVHS